MNMAVAYMNTSRPDFILLLIGAVIAVLAIGQYGRKTQLGYTGSILISIFASPIIGFVVVYYLRSRM
jgi:phosphate/sulfate permease